MAIRAIKVRLRPRDDSPEALADFRAAVARWKQICERVQEMFNRAWVVWRLWHEEAGTPRLIREAIEELRTWHNTPPADRGPKPKAKIDVLPNVLLKHIGKVISEEFPDVHVRTAGLLQQQIRKLMLHTKSTKGTLPGSWSILLCRQGLPAATDWLPIPIDDGNTILRADGKKLLMTVRTDRIARTGQRGISTADVVAVYPAKRDWRGRVILGDLAAGRRKFKGSKIAIDRGQPVMFLSYEIADADPTNRDGVAVVAPGRLASLNIRVGGKTIRLIRDVADVAGRRQSVQQQRWARQSNYRHAGSSTKGHGRQRALQAVTRLAQAWKCFQKTRNEHMAAVIDEVCARNGVGNVVFVQPTPERGRSTKRLLNLAGNVFPETSTAGWDWFSFGSILSRRLMRSGLTVSVVKKA